MKVVNFDKNSEEWLEYRRGKITGTKLKNLYPKTNPTKGGLTSLLEDMGIDFNPKATIEKILEPLDPMQLATVKAHQPKKDEFYKLVADLVARPVNFNDYEAPDGVKVGWRERGHILEPEALRAVEELLGKKISSEDVVWVDDNNPNMMISPDGPIEAEVITEAVEIKCPDNHTVIRAWDEQKYPDEYHEQVLQYFIINEKLETLYFGIYTDCIPSLPLQIFEVKREDVAHELEVYREYQKITLEQVQKLAERLAF